MAPALEAAVCLIASGIFRRLGLPAGVSSEAVWNSSAASSPLPSRANAITIHAAACVYTVSPPAGFTPVPSRAADVASAFGRYRRSERVEAGRLAREDQSDLLRGRVAPADYPAFAGFASAVDAAQEEPIAFQRSNPG